MANRVPFQMFLPMMRNPDIFAKMARGVLRKYVWAPQDYWNEDGSSSSLWLISMRITHRCNHHCAICGQWGDKGYNKVKGAPKVMGEVSLDEYKKMVDSVLHIKPHIYITGGEPFLYKGLIPLVNYMKSKGLSVQIVTNGVGLEKNAETIVENGWDMLCVSLDGPREVHDKCRGLEGAYDTVQKGIRTIQELKKRRGVRKPTFYTLTTISDVNQDRLVETLRVAESLEPDVMIVYYQWFTSEELGKKYTAILEKAMDVEPFAWKSYARDMSGVDSAKIAARVREVKAQRFRMPVVFVPQIEESEIAMYFADPGNFLGWKKCLAPWFQVDIMPNGDVVNCRDFPDIVMGNILESPLEEIYNNKRFCTFRKTLRQCRDGVFPTCSRCCGLMGY